jgi:aminoglycoside phosphotransferase (APT) family kinase protein
LHLGGHISGLERLSGGASKETWSFRAGDRDLILRRSTHAAAVGDGIPLGAEAALMRRVGTAGVPVPEIVHVCGPADDLGSAFVMARIDGETLGRRIVRDEAFADVRPALAKRCGEVMAAIHAMPLQDLPPLETMSASDVLNRYETLYRATGARRPVLEAAFPWLRNRAAPLTAPALVHGDFRNGNLIVHPKNGLVAVLDWELAHLGDPAEDLGWICVNSWRFGGRGPVGGFGPYEDLLAGYEAAGGTALSLETLLYWQAVGSLKWAVMCLMIYGIHASGTDPSVERAMVGRRVSEAEIDLIVLMEQAL